MVEIYDVDQLSKSVQDFVAKRELENAREIYLECIMDWTDHFTENLSSDDTLETEKLNALKSIANIWVSYAKFEESEKQYKKAALVYEKAIEDPIGKTLPDIYTSYSWFCENRGKSGNAKNILIKGVTSQLHSDACDKLWVDLLTLMRKSGSNNLTLQHLYDAVKLEKGSEVIVTAPSEKLLKEYEVRDIPTVAIKSEIQVTDHALSSSATHINENAVSMEISSETSNLIEPVLKSKPSDIELNTNNLTPEQMNKIYSKRPPMLFNISDTDTTRFRLSNKEIIELENFLGVKLRTDIAVPNSSDLDISHLKPYLDLIEGLWTYQALTERTLRIYFYYFVCEHHL